MPSAKEARAPQSTSRVGSLDGLRGVAALVVVLFHVALVSPALAAVEAGPHTRPDLVSVVAYSPVRLLWSGDEAVVVFFVLSGFVLTLPLRHRAANWVGYYPRRLVRLYVPVWGSIALTLGWWFAVPRVTHAGDSWWITAHHHALSLLGVAGDATMLLGTTGANSVLWSLRWEVWFSLLLPLYLLALLRFRRFPLAKVLVLAAAAEAGQLLDLDWLRWLPVFGLGVVAAAELDTLRRLVSALGRGRDALVLVAALVLIELRWMVLGAMPVAGVTALGAVLLVVVFATWAPAIAVGSARPIVWLGRISFSLYLVHEPIVVSTAIVLRSRDPLLVGVVSIPVALIVAELFFRVVELPAHQLSKAVGRWAVAIAQPGPRTTQTGNMDEGDMREPAPSP